MPRDSFTVFAYSRSSDKSQYAPATLASDINRLLDPAYACVAPSDPAFSHPLGGYTQAKVYVDHMGDMHDPDYRDFPVLPTTFSRRPRAQRASSSAYSYTSHYGRPNWERGYTSETESDASIVEPSSDGRWARDGGSTTGVMPFASATRSRSGSASTTASSYVSQEPINFYHRPSFEQSIIFDDDAPEAEEPVPKEDTDCAQTPRHAHSLRYQLHSIRLGLRLKVFRAQRRWRERRHSDASIPIEA